MGLVDFSILWKEEGVYRGYQKTAKIVKSNYQGQFQKIELPSWHLTG
jgi:hypothetical protein